MFKTKTGISLPGASPEQLLEMRKRLIEEFGFTYPQLVEAASYSMAMVVRFALGLSAEGGRVACIFEDSLTGWISLATVRHLLNAGSEAELIYIGSQERVSDQLNLQLGPLGKMGCSVTVWTKAEENETIADLLSGCHNSLCGYYDISRAITPFEKNINEVLNELSTPIYTIEGPPGIDPLTGQSQGSPLYASCTMSLGAPLTGFITGNDYLGRHYLCDISLTKELYKVIDSDFSIVFADQPVQEIFVEGEQKQE